MPPICKTPMHILIDELEDSVNIKKVELESAHEHLAQLELKYSNPGLKPDKTKGQCGQCHKHDIDKKQLLDTSQNVKTINRDLEKLKEKSCIKKRNTQRNLSVFFLVKLFPTLSIPIPTNIILWDPLAYGP